MTTTITDPQGLTFSDAVRVSTSRGPRILRKASPNAAFWLAWKAQKVALKAAGYSVLKDRSTGAWTVCHWSEVDDDAAATVAMSRATDADIEIPVPKNSGLSYLPFQRAGIAFAASRPATLIADEMGLGKTIMTCGLINLIEPNSRVLVVCPASLKINWEREASRWLVNNPTIGIATASEWPDSRVVIINYDILGRHKDEIDIEWDMVIFDEAHYLKNPKAQRTKLALAIRADRKLMLTGTPILNRPVEIQPLVGYLHPEFSNFFAFAKRYCDARKGKWGWDFTGSSNTDELQERLRGTVMIRRMKRDVLAELPPKRRQVIVVPADTRELESALAEETKEMETLAEAVDSTSTIEVLFEEMSAVRHRMALAKVSTIVSMVEEIDHPIVIFAHHHDVVDGIADGLSERSVVTLTGQHSANERQAAVEAFQNGEADVFIGTIGAAGVGITLTRASHVLFAELAWTPGEVTQAEDRCHRIGQSDSVLITHVVVDRSIDARMSELIVEKQAVLDAVLDDHSTTKEKAPVGVVIPGDVIDVNDLISKVVIEPPADGIDLSSLPAGRYAVPGGDTRLKVRVSKPEDGRWAGFVFVSDAAEYGSRKRYGTQHPGEGDMYRGKVQDALKEIMKDPLAASMAYGLLTATCGVCGRALEDAQSVSRGIGPICLSRF